MSTLTITDDRTGKQYKVPIQNGAIPAMELRKIKVSEDDFGLMSYDPAFMNTASCQSKVTFIDGEKGILRYRGYPIEQLAEKCSYLEVAYLLLKGELPTESQLSLEHHAPHLPPREHQEVHGWFPLRCASHGNAGEHRGRALDLLSGCQGRREPQLAPATVLPSYWQVADNCGVRLSTQYRNALCLSGQ